MRYPTIKMIENLRCRIAFGGGEDIFKIFFQGKTVYKENGESMDSKDFDTMTNEEILECIVRVPEEPYETILGFKRIENVKKE